MPKSNYFQNLERNHPLLYIALFIPLLNNSGPSTDSIANYIFILQEILGERRVQLSTFYGQQPILNLQKRLRLVYQRSKEQNFSPENQ